MKKFNVPFKVEVYGNMDVEAESIDEAIEQVESNKLEIYCGNGGFNKLIGTSEENIGLDESTPFEVIEESIEEGDDLF